MAGVLGFVVGIAAGVAGVGGTYALVPAPIHLFGAPVYIAMGTSLATTIPLAVVGGGIKPTQGFLDLPTGPLLALRTIAGPEVGAATIKRIQPVMLKPNFGPYSLYVAAKFVASYFGIAIWWAGRVARHGGRQRRIAAGRGTRDPPGGNVGIGKGHGRALREVGGLH